MDSLNQLIPVNGTETSVLIHPGDYAGLNQLIPVNGTETVDCDLR